MADAIICRRSGGGGSIPSSMLEKVTAPALENITMGQAVEYRMYPGEDVFTYSSQANPGHFLAASADFSILCFRGTGTATYRYLYIWELIDGLYTLVQTLDTGSSTKRMFMAAVSNDNSLIAAGYYNDGSGVLLYRYNGTSYVAVGNTLFVGGSQGSLLFTPGNKYLVIGCYDDPLAVHKIDPVTGATTQCTVTGALEGSEGTYSYWLSCDSAVNYIVHNFNTTGSSSTTERLQIYKRTGDSFTAVVSLSGVSTSYRAAISPTGKFIVMNKALGMDFYKFENDVLTLITPSAGNWPTTQSGNYAFSPDGKYLYAAVGTTPYIWIMKIDSNADSITKLANPSTLPPGSGNVYCSADGRQVLLCNISSPTLTFYTTGTGEYILPLRNLRDARYFALNQYANYKLGIADATATAGQPCTATMLKVLNEVIT